MYKNAGKHLQWKAAEIGRDKNYQSKNAKRKAARYGEGNRWQKQHSEGINTLRS